MTQLIIVDANPIGHSLVQFHSLDSYFPTIRLVFFPYDPRVWTPGSLSRDFLGGGTLKNDGANLATMNLWSLGWPFVLCQRPFSYFQSLMLIFRRINRKTKLLLLKTHKKGMDFAANFIQIVAKSTKNLHKF